MKITMNLDCTPEEARIFFGLPDIRPLQEAVLREVQEQMTANMRAMDPAAIVKMWLPAGIEGWKRWQEAFAARSPRKE